MSDTNHPDNIFPQGPSNLDPQAISNEIANARYAIGLSAGGLALGSTLMVTEVVPTFVEAASNSDISSMLEYGTVGAFVVGVSALAIANIRAYGGRLRQARYNQRFSQIADDNEI
jgi:hypothetical protein